MNRLLYIAFGLPLLMMSSLVRAQNENALIRKGNRLYKEKKIDESRKAYEQAVKVAPDNPVAHYNLGNSEYRKDEFENAERSYDQSAAHDKDPATREMALYNKGVAEIKQRKLEESINSWKDALKLDPTDTAARENLQKALRELKSKQPPPPPKQDKKDQKKDQQKQPQSKLSKQEVEEKLKSIQQKEQEVQNKMNQNKTRSLSQPDKDW